jgi:drug/metabolite transporter (DMT)-like permease
MEKLLVTLYILTTSSALICLKWGSSAGAPISAVAGKLALNLNPFVMGGIFLYGTSFLIYTYLISKYDLGYIIPLTTAFVYIIIFFASFTIFRESFTAFKIAGIALIVGGIFLLNVK